MRQNSPPRLALLIALGLCLTAVSTDESPTHLGPPLTYTRSFEVTLQRPDKLRIISPGGRLRLHRAVLQSAAQSLLR